MNCMVLGSEGKCGFVCKTALRVNYLLIFMRHFGHVECSSGAVDGRQGPCLGVRN